MSSIHVLLLCGGGSAEHEVSLVSANYIEEQLKQIDDIAYTRVEMKEDGWFDQNGLMCQLNLDKTLQTDFQQAMAKIEAQLISNWPIPVTTEISNLPEPVELDNFL